MPLAVDVPQSAGQLDDVRHLMQSFIAWHRRRHTEDLHLIDAYFDAAAFDAELAGLPGKYAPPDGQLLLATVDGEAAGCVALRRIDATQCEMKRMFVHEQFHGQGVGRALANAIIAQGRALGFDRMLLDTSIRQIEAQRLYASCGFQIVPPYYALNDDVRNWLVFMELALDGRSPDALHAAV